MNRSKRRRTRWILGGAVIAAVVVSIAVTSLQKNTVFFYTPKEVLDQAPSLQGRVIRVGAMVQPGSVQWNAEDLTLTFLMTDFSGSAMHAVYRGSPPDLFKEGQGVIVEGKINTDGGTIAAQKLMVKHSEEYRSPGDKTNLNHELLMKSLFKDEGRANPSAPDSASGDNGP